MTVRLKEGDKAVLNSKLKLNGFETLSEFVHTWINESYPIHENNEQVVYKEMIKVIPVTAFFSCYICLVFISFFWWRMT
jgi:hypothetical protein